MRRVHAIELHEQALCPDVLRRLATDYLRTVAEASRAFDPVAPRLASLLASVRPPEIVDLCSGGGGPVPSLAERVRRDFGVTARVVLTDLHPNRAAFALAEARSTRVEGRLDAVDARAVPRDLRGVRTIFDAFHHFRPEQARAILADAAAQRAPLLIVEATERTWAAIAGMLLVVPLLALLVMPFVRPFSVARILLTYVVPVAVPLIVFDGVISCLRSYTVAELEELARGLGDEGYRFTVGVTRSRGQRLTWLCGERVVAR
jgi:hypothetical protein